MIHGDVTMKRLISALVSCAVVLSASQPVIIQNHDYVCAASDEIIEGQLDMPVISIDTNASSISSKETYTDAKITVWDEDKVLDMDACDMSVRLRGNITLKLNKKSYKIKFPEKQNPLGIGDGKGKTWNLVANYYDTSLLRNMAAYHLGDLMDAMPYSANSKSVELYVNGEYQGVYLLCEAVNVNKNRVAITENPDLVEDNGYLVQMSRYAEENVFIVGDAQYEVKSDVSEDPEIQKQQVEYISGYITSALEALKSGSKEETEKYIDTASLVDNYIANEVCKNVDSGWDSYYMAKDADSKLIFEPMWDYDLALGNNTEAKGIASYAGLNIFNVTDSSANSNPWLCYAVHSEWFREAVAQRWKEKCEDIKTVPEFVMDEAEKNARSYDRNFTKWNTLGKNVYNEPDEIAKLTTHIEHAQYLSTWIENRIDWLDTYFTSEDFLAGILKNEKDEEVNTDNIIITSALMFLGDGGTVDIDSPGFNASAGSQSGWMRPQALSAGFMLHAGQKYKLSFDYSGSPSATISYRIQQNHDRYTAYFSQSVTVSEEVQDVQKEFTISADDTNCALVMEFIGTGDVKVEHLSLVPVKEDTVKGDVNADGEVTAGDVVMFKNWFLNAGNLTDIKASDLDGDGVVNIADFCVLKSLITGE